MSDKKYLTKTEAVNEMGVTPSALRKLLRDKTVKRYRRPGYPGILIAREELERALEPQEITS